MDLVRTDRSTGKERAYEPTPAATDLLDRCRTLLAEIVSFQDFAASRKCKSIDLRHFKSAIQAEEKSLTKLAQADQSASLTIHNLRSSNLPFYEALWTAAKSSQRLIGLQKRFYWNRSSRVSGKGKQKKKSALVDIVAEEGSRWIKVSTVTESKLLFEKAKVGWEADEWNDSSDDGQAGRKILAEGAEPISKLDESSDDDEDEGQLELVKVANSLMKASLATRIRFKHPQTFLVLPNIEPGTNKAIDGILAELRAVGVQLQCGKQAPSCLTSIHDSSCFEHMLPLFRPVLTNVVNLDCTVLLALISDLSHGNVDELVLPDKPHPSLTYQVEVERATPLLPQILYPGLRNVERLVTSARSAARMWDIVKIIGTPTEHERARILLGVLSEDDSENPTSQDGDSLRKHLAKLSIHDVPPLPLPVKVIDDGINTASNIPSRILGRVSGQLSDINRSVFLLGWTNGWTTVTSNQVAVKTIETTIHDELNRGQNDATDGDAFDGPVIWSIDIARSLVGKESGRANG